MNKLKKTFDSWKNYHLSQKTREMMGYTAKFFHQKKLFKRIFNAFGKYILKKVFF